MSFKLGDIVIDRALQLVCTDFSDNAKFALSHLTNISIDVTAESKEAKDENNVLIKKFYTGKSGIVSAENALCSMGLIELASGSEAEIATADHKVTMPKIEVYKASEKPTLTGAVAGTVKVNAYSTTGALGKAYTQAATASATEFGLTGANALTLPTDGEVQFIVRYEKEVTNGAAIKNKADSFPGTYRGYLTVLACDPCSADTLKRAVIKMPSMTISPELTLELTTDATLKFEAALGAAYCDVDKSLYEFYWDDDDEV